MNNIGSAVCIFAYMTHTRRLRNLKLYDKSIKDQTMTEALVYTNGGEWINFPDVFKKGSRMKWIKIR